MKKIAFILSLFILPFIAMAGNIHVKRANKLKGGTFEGVKINKLLGNVLMQQENTLLYCDSAYQYLSKNEVIAFGHVRLIHNDSINASGSKLVYNGDSKVAVLSGEKVVLIDPTMRLETTNLIYNTTLGTGRYTTFGKVESDGAILTSRSGLYNSTLQYYSFYGNVDLVKDDYHLTSDTLNYSTAKKIAYYYGPTHLVSSNQCVYAEKGQYIFNNEESKISKNAIVENNDFSIVGDSLYFNNKTSDGYGEGNVVLFAFKDSVQIEGDYAIRTGAEYKSEVYGFPVMKKLLSGDTVFLTADRLITVNDTIQKKNDIYAYNNVKVFKNDLQAVCDSLHYGVSDSTLTFFTSPVLWNDKSQITADTIKIFLNEGKLDKMKALRNAFIISEDENLNFNQVKGKEMDAQFELGQLADVEVTGNGQSLYFANDDVTKQMMGMNKVICSSMLIVFEKNELNDILFRTKPESNFMPPQNIAKPDKKMKGFQWLIEKKPVMGSFERKKNI